MNDSVNDQRQDIPKAAIPKARKQSEEPELTIVLKTELLEKYKKNRSHCYEEE